MRRRRTFTLVPILYNGLAHAALKWSLAYTSLPTKQNLDHPFSQLTRVPNTQTPLHETNTLVHVLTVVGDEAQKQAIPLWGRRNETIMLLADCR